MPVTIEHDEHGRAIACKWASGSRIARLRRETELLALAQHPGVVELQDVRFDELSASLRMSAAAGPPLDRCPALAPDEVAAIMAALAATVADLHAIGMVHGALEAAHVVLDADGRPLLCGFADARVRSEDAAADPASDVADLGILLRALLAASPPTASGRREPVTEVLSTLAGWATALDPSARPTAAELAKAISQRVPTARLPRLAALQARRSGPLPAGLATLLAPHANDSTPSESAAVSHPQPEVTTSLAGGRRHWRRLIAALVAVAVAAGLVVVMGSVLDGAARPQLSAEKAPTTTALSAAPSSPRTTTGDDESTPLATRVWPGRGDGPATRSDACPAVFGHLQADVDGDGCDEALEFRDGVLSSGTWRWSVGVAEDRLATGDWICRPDRPRSTLAVLRKADASVWVFSDWPTATGATTTAQRWGSVADAADLRRSDPDGDGCAELVVQRRDGIAVPVRRPGTVR